MPEISIDMIMKRAREAILVDEQEERNRAKRFKESEDQANYKERIIKEEEKPTKESSQSEENKESGEMKFDNSQNLMYHLGYELCQAYRKNESKSKKKSKRKRRQVVDSDDEDTDDRTEAHVVCLNCGHYNHRDEPMFRWISCLMCNNWFHLACTSYWDKSEKEMEELQFICEICT